ncbi:glycoside hydrolase family 3 protein [Gynuella sp.]|uniref:glycoside hydrolase family 3 protein n=1 Tax=Gynuella sp. TaxID=2969146 RepID=UPI003D0CDBEF
MTKFTPLLVASALALTSGCNDNSNDPDTPSSPDTNNDMVYRTDYQDWPEITSAIPLDPAIEAQIDTLIMNMTLAEKVGQMVQPEIKQASPQDVIDYHLGSVLNGGGSWPNNDKNASAADWLALADSYWEASMNTDDGKAAIPLIWGTDAVHGHSNVMGTVLFPHNIGLGATRDPALIKRIGQATARQVTATGIDWTFAPTLAVVRDDRWGRSYEGYSEDGEIVFNYAGAMVEGLQGNFGDDHVLATAKHYIGDGGTDQGDDQGDNLSNEQDLINIHGQGYYSALSAGAQTVMASFNSWNGEKLHGHEYLLNTVLKGKMHFDGFIVSDWNGVGQVTGCTNSHCPQAVNAGIDMIMVPDDWKALITNTIQDVNDGAIAMSRIDDAVRRILRVKFRAGLFTKTKPSERQGAGDDNNLHTDDMRALAREAVRKSLVLLKNNADTLPLSKDARILVTGKTADNMMNQTGGWSLSWQGTGNTNSDFPYGDTILDGINNAISGTGEVTYSRDGSAANENYDVIIAVIGETPYAEGNGDIGKFSTLSFGSAYPADAKLLDTLSSNAPSVPVVTVYVGGRPLWMNPELNKSSAFVAAWLPGTEGAGVADVLFGDYPFTGKLSFSWPATDCQTTVNRNDGQTPLFAYGFGLSTSDDGSLSTLSEETSNQGCGAGDNSSAGTTEVPLELFSNGNTATDYALRIGGPSNWSGTEVDIDPSATSTLPDNEITVKTIDGSVQFSAKNLVWNDIAQIYIQSTDANTTRDLAAYSNSETSISFRVRVHEAPAESVEAVNLSAHCVYPCVGEINIAGLLRSLPLDTWQDIKIPLACLTNTGLDITSVNTPFLLYSSGAMNIDIENIGWQPWTEDEALDCGTLQPPVQAPTISSTTSVYSNGIDDSTLFKQPAKWAANTDTWEETPDFITLDTAYNEGGNTVIDAQYGNAADHKGIVILGTVKDTDLSQLPAGSYISFDLNVISLGESNGLTAKMVCNSDPDNCRSGDLDITTLTDEYSGAIPLQQWYTYHIILDNYADLDKSKITTVLELLPNWADSHNNVHFQLDNVKIVANNAP